MLLLGGEGLERFADSDVRVIPIPDNATIGRKRNELCAAAPGGLIAHCDDDDWSSPSRISSQCEALCRSGLAVHGFRSMRFTDGRGWWMYRGSSHYAIGTSLLYRRSWWEAHAFREVQVGEDNDFVMEARRAGQLVAADAGDLMWASIHPGNTSPRILGSSNWKKL